MTDNMNKEDSLLDILREREKELNCLYKVDEILSNHQLSIPEVFHEIIRIIPTGFRLPKVCHVKIVFNNSSYHTPGFRSSHIYEICSIKVDARIVGNIEVVYIQDVPRTKEGYFLEKEIKLIKTIADRVGQMIVYRQMKSVMSEWELSKQHNSEVSKNNSEWKIIIDFLHHTDQSLLHHICRKLINYLLINGINEASDILNKSVNMINLDAGYINYPTSREPIENVTCICEKAFSIAKKHLANDEITIKVKRWIQEENAYSLIKSITSVSPSLRNIIEELKKYHKIIKDNDLLYSPQERWITVGLINHFLSDRSEFVNIAKQYIGCRDFFDIINRMIIPIQSQGKLGGKGSGLFLAQKILEKESDNFSLLSSVKIPKTWYIVTDTITEFLQYNNLEELNEQKYKELQETRIEYPNILQLIKNSKLPPEILKSLSVALDDFGEVPIIVRSSSMLEDQIGAAFSGKYKSLFLANQGSKQKRLEALEDAVLEVYASVYSPDPIQYRAERGLLDFHEEMGIMIQEVVGTRIGKYFFPLFSGVAFSNNEYRWSPRIKREDGLIRIVPGLGTRAVDRLSDDFPVLISPGQPKIRVNIVPEEIQRYSPKKIDVINLEDNNFETIDISLLLKNYGEQIHNINKVVSILEFNHIKVPNKFEINFEKNDLIVTFDGIVSDSLYIKKIDLILKILKEKIGVPIDIEFASDGNELYLLQCRPQSFSIDSAPAPIPQDTPHEDIVFNAFRYISNGVINNISHIVYVDTEEYNKLNNLEDLNNVGKVVGMLNSILPRRQFILIGPGRWGSRGDIKLGVQVGYSDICNTAALIEVAKKKTGYLPELSFGTHFFQDLVEANIRYLPLYPDDNGIIFNSTFLLKSKNILKDIFPEFQYLEDVIRVIHVPDSADGRILKILMNAEIEEAVGFLSSYTNEIQKETKKFQYNENTRDDSAWRWRFHIAEHMASMFDASHFGVKALYLFGSSNNGTAGSGSDIDLLIHFDGNEQQKNEMMNWFQGWSLCLAEMNYLKTGYRMDGLLDLHIITDEDIKKKTSFAIKIDSVTDPAYRLKVKS